jgi:plasmid stabilization system protein ParE
MNAAFQFTPQAAEDLDGIWWFIAEDNLGAADGVELEIVATCRRLAKHPLMGVRRQDITPLPVRFWTVMRFPNYVIADGRVTDGFIRSGLSHRRLSPKPFSTVCSQHADVADNVDRPSSHRGKEDR